MSSYLATLAPISVDCMLLCIKVNKRRKTKFYLIKVYLDLVLQAIHTLIHSSIYVIVTYLEFTMSKKILWDLRPSPHPTENKKEVGRKHLICKTHLQLMKKYGK